MQIQTIHTHTKRDPNTHTQIYLERKNEDRSKGFSKQK